MYSIYTIFPEQYPELLQQISSKPKHLDVIGILPDDSYTFLCVIGSRTPSPYGIEACRKIILELQGQRVVIISGLAIGIDSIAHEAALDAGLITVAFPGSGLLPEVLYPASRRGLAERIVESGGALISSFKPDQTGAPWTFPVRNRWMAGMSHAVLIIEGREGSGTMGTATYATELNRDVLIVPGSLFSDLSHGPLLLMKEGATPVTSGSEVMSELKFAEERLQKVPRSPERLAAMLAKRKKLEEMRLAGKHISSQSVPRPSGISRINLEQLDLSPEERKICELLKYESLNSTQLIEKTGLPVTTLNITISELEMKGLVAQSGGRYSLNH